MKKISLTPKEKEALQQIFEKVNQSLEGLPDEYVQLLEYSDALFTLYDRKKISAQELESAFDCDINETSGNPAFTNLVAKVSNAVQYSLVMSEQKYIPNNDVFNTLIRVISSGLNFERLKNKKTDRETIEVFRNKAALVISKKMSRPTEYSEIFIKLTNPAAFEKGGKAFVKMLTYILQQAILQSSSTEVQINLRHMVEIGMFTRTESAKRALFNFYDKQTGITLNVTNKKGLQVFAAGTAGVCQDYISYNNAIVKLYLNKNIAPALLKSYFAELPQYAYSLSDNAFCLIRLIYSCARQKLNQIKDGGKFTLSAETIRAYLGLPLPAETRKFTQYIYGPIQTAVAEIEEASARATLYQSGLKIELPETCTAKTFSMQSAFICMPPRSLDHLLEVANKKELQEKKREKARLNPPAQKGTNHTN